MTDPSTRLPATLPSAAPCPAAPDDDRPPVLVLRGPEVIAALTDARLVPPAAPATLGSGATARLRDDMARFAAPGLHGPRRRLVEAAIAGLDPGALATVAAERTRARLGADTVELAPLLAGTVPVEAVALGVGLVDAGDETALAGVVADVTAVVAAIGRGEPADAGTDAAAERLLALAGGDRERAVATVSLLYQTLDATVSLVAVTAAAGATGADPAVPVRWTMRLATTPVRLAGSGVGVGAGEVVRLDLASAGVPFGHGPHRCPGRDLAVVLCEAVLAALAAAGYTVASGDVTVDGDGRPGRIVARLTGPDRILR